MNYRGQDVALACISKLLYRFCYLLSQVMKSANVHPLGRMKLLRYLDDPELEVIADFFRTRKFRKGSTLIREGSRDRSIYLVRSGKFVVHHTVRGKERELGKFSPGDHFGELSF